METKKISIALAGVMSAVAIASVVPMGTAGTLGSVATVAHALYELKSYIDKDTVIDGDAVVRADEICGIGNYNRCVVIINGDLTLEAGSNGYYDEGLGEWFDDKLDGGCITIDNGSLVIINGNFNVNELSDAFVYDDDSRFIVTGEFNNDSDIDEDYIIKPFLTDIGYVAESDVYYEHFTSGGKYYTFDYADNVFVETTEAAVTKATPATVTGTVTNVVANNEGYSSNGTKDNGATAFITTLTQSGDGDVTVSSVTWDITSNSVTKSFTKSDELPTMTFNGDGTGVTLALVIDNLYDATATAVVTVAE